MGDRGSRERQGKAYSRGAKSETQKEKHHASNVFAGAENARQLTGSPQHRVRVPVNVGLFTYCAPGTMGSEHHSTAVRRFSNRLISIARAPVCGWLSSYGTVHNLQCFGGLAVWSVVYFDYRPGEAGSNKVQ